MEEVVKGEKHLETCVTNHALIKLIITHSFHNEVISWNALIVRPCVGANEEHEESDEVALNVEAAPSVEIAPSTEATPNNEITYVVETATSSKIKTIACSKWSSGYTPLKTDQWNHKSWSSIRTTPS